MTLMKSKAFMKLFFILWMMLAISSARSHLSPISAATAQTFGTFNRGMEAVGGNPAYLAYKSKNYYITYHTYPPQDTTYYFDTLPTPSKSEPDSLSSLLTDSLHIQTEISKRDTTYEQSDENYRINKENIFFLEVFNLGVLAGNSSVDVDWLNTNIFNSGYLDDSKKENSFKAVIHCAGLTSVLDGTNKYSTNFLYKNNILSTLNSLKICSILKSKYIYISSSRVYSIPKINELRFKIEGKGFKLGKNKTRGISSKGINEDFPTDSPLSFYGSSKLMSENLIIEFCLHNKIPFIINRCGLLAGSGQFYKNDQGIISYWINSWKKNKELKFIGFGCKGYQVRDCLHPWDLANLINKQLGSLDKGHLKKFIFNASGGISSAFSLKDLSLWCEKEMHQKKIKLKKANRPFDLKWIVLDNTKAKAKFNWRVMFSKEKIFEDINLND